MITYKKLKADMEKAGLHPEEIMVKWIVQYVNGQPKKKKVKYVDDLLRTPLKDQVTGTL